MVKFFCLLLTLPLPFLYIFFHGEFCRHKIVIVEGNYLLLRDGAWKEVSSMFDEKW